MHCPLSDVNFTDPQYLSLLHRLAEQMNGLVRGNVPVVSVAGAQGSGKTTLALALQRLLQEQYAIGAVTLSLDDFYLTREERHRLAQDVHPLLSTRGVPGTHDVDWMTRAIDALRQGRSTEIPRFDKAVDDRMEALQPVPPAQLVICEGWCWGAVPEPSNRLVSPLNRLEAEKDPDGSWRRYVNRRLEDYQPLFENDCHIFLQVPSTEAVFQWRWQQEQELRLQAGEAGRVMNEQQVRDFIQYYERITRWMLETSPSRADVCVTLDDDHRFSGDSGTIQ